jgi:hypothetical protein
MVTILSAVICLKTFCYVVTVPTPITFELQSCVHYGRSLAQNFVDPHWTVKRYQCEAGREA